MKTDYGKIRLGDVVVSKPAGINTGVIQFDHGKARTGSFERTGALAPPPAALLQAAQGWRPHGLDLAEIRLYRISSGLILVYQACLNSGFQGCHGTSCTVLIIYISRTGLLAANVDVTLIVKSIPTQTTLTARWRRMVSPVLWSIEEQLLLASLSSRWKEERLVGCRTRCTML